MKRFVSVVWTLGLSVCLSGCSLGTSSIEIDWAGVSAREVRRPEVEPADRVIRVATFNAALSRGVEGELAAALALFSDEKAKLVAEVIQRVRPDVVLLQEFDYDASGQSVLDFQANYLEVSQNGAEVITYEHFYMPEVNTGVPMVGRDGEAIDANGDGEVGGPADAHGWGNYPGHYGMVVLSRWPISVPEQVGRMKRWRHVPGLDESVRVEAVTSDPEVVGAWRLSSKTHELVVIDLGVEGAVGLRGLALLMAHPTPPVFDGPEDRNGRRNAAELAYLAEMAGDDVFERVSGLYGPVVLGDLNADPHDGESRPGAVAAVLRHPALQDSKPQSVGGWVWAELQGGVNAVHRTEPTLDTADWGDEPGAGPGNLRVDYVLPSVDLEVVGSGVFWPGPADRWVYLNEASDHRLVWVDVVLPAE